jgi:polysaccharide pyruvyl transferase WcaK-like protein
VSRVRISFYGNFGAGNLGNEATLEAIIERILRRWPDGQLACFCTNPEDVRARHGIAALPAGAINRSPGQEAKSIARWRGASRFFRIAFKRIPLEFVHWIKCGRALSRADMLVIAGTGIVCDYTTGPFGYPYDIFKLSTLAAVCRVKLVFLSVGAGPIDHPLSRWLLKTSLAFAEQRSYRDEASKRYLREIGFDTDGDPVYPDVVFGLAKPPPAHEAAETQRRIIGLGIKDYASTKSDEFREYLDTMATFVLWLQGKGYSVRLLIGDIQYDSSVLEQFISVLKIRNIAADTPLLIAEPALTVEELLRQVGETEAVVSARYHNLVMALIQNKPVIALSDHPKLNSVGRDFGLAEYVLPLGTLSSDVLISKFQQLKDELDELKPQLKLKLAIYRRALDELYMSLFDEGEQHAPTSQTAGHQLSVKHDRSDARIQS